MRTEDGYIVYKCINGDSASFGLLVDKYRESIYGLAYSKLGNFHDAEDVTQEVFIKAYQKLRKLKRYDSFLAWLYSITTNLCKDLLRSRSRRPDQKFLADEEPGVLRTLSINSHRDEIALENLRDTLNSLPDIYRQVLILHYLSGMSIEEMAKFIGISSNNVRQRLWRARSYLKEEMLTIMNTGFEQKRLKAGFTLNIIEKVKRMKIDPVPRTESLPWGLSIAAGVILAVLSLSPLQNLHDFLGFSRNSASSSGVEFMGNREFPISLMTVSQESVLLSQQNKNNDEKSNFNQENPAPNSLQRKQNLPVGPSARLGKGATGIVKYSPDGKLLALAGNGGIWLYDAVSLKEVGFLKGHTFYVACIAFSPDGNYLTSGGWDYKVRLWDVKRQKELAVFPEHGDYIWSLAFSPDGKILASAGHDKMIRLWDVNERKQMAVLKGHEEIIDCVAFSPDGKSLASGDRSGYIRLWHLGGQREIAAFKGHNSGVGSLSFSPDGKLIASSSWHDGLIRLWDLESHKEVVALQGHKVSKEKGGGVGYVSFNPDGRLLASSGTDKTVRLWDMNNYQQIAEFSGNTSYFISIAFSPDGKTLSSSDEATVLFWNVDEKKQTGELKGFTGEIKSVVFSPDGKTLVSSGGIDGNISFWDAKEQKKTGLLVGHKSYVDSVAFSPDGKTLASGSRDTTIRLWDVQSQKHLATLTGHTGWANCVAFSPDGKLLVSAGRDDLTVHLWDLENKKSIATLTGHTELVRSVAFSPDGRIVASGSEDSTVRLWDVNEQKLIAILQGQKPVYSVAFSPDGKLLASGAIRIIQLWDPISQKEIATLKGHNEGAVYSVAFSPDGKILASCGYWDKSIRFWDVKERKELTVLRDLNAVLYSVAFSPDGKWLASGGGDGMILLWEMEKVLTTED